MSICRTAKDNKLKQASISRCEQPWAGTTFCPFIKLLPDALPFPCMQLLVAIGIRLLEAMFVIGAIGSFLVLVLSGIEDIETLFGSSEEPERGTNH